MTSSTIDMGNTAWVMVCVALVFIMIPGLAFFYSGVTLSRNPLSLIFFYFICIVVVSVEWVLLGFSLSLSPSGSPVIGDFKYALLLNTENSTHPSAPTIPTLVYSTYHSLLAAVAPAIAFGPIVERSSLSTVTILIFAWSLIVYNPIAYWVWAPNGWAAKMGVLDFSGAIPVHICAGMAGLAYSICTKPKKAANSTHLPDLHQGSFFNVMLGISLIWIGCFGLASGATGGANYIAGLALLNTNTSAAVSSAAWLILAFIKYRRVSCFHFCSGVVVGLVAITPASGFISPWAAMVVGMVCGSVCSLAVEVKTHLGFEDNLDVFSIHAIGGLCGSLLTGIFARGSLISLNSAVPRHVSKGGALDGLWYQLLVQLIVSLVCAIWSFLTTYLLLLLTSRIWFLKNTGEGDNFNALVYVGSFADLNIPSELARRNITEIGANDSLVTLELNALDGTYKNHSSSFGSEALSEEAPFPVRDAATKRAMEGFRISQ